MNVKLCQRHIKTHWAEGAEWTIQILSVGVFEMGHCMLFYVPFIFSAETTKVTLKPRNLLLIMRSEMLNKVSSVITFVITGGAFI